MGCAKLAHTILDESLCTGVGRGGYQGDCFGPTGGAVNAGQQVGETPGGQERANDLDVDVGERILGHRDVLDVQMMMKLNFVALALLTFPGPHGDVPVHPVPYETGVNAVLGSANAGVGTIA